MKTSELTGAALDWAVAQCEDFKKVYVYPAWSNKHGAYGPAQVMVSVEKNSSYDYCPSTNWNQAGPIIEREKVSATFFPDGAHPEGGAWLAYALEYPHEEYGPTPLIAACRCYVASKLGDEVEIPEELSCEK